LYFDSVLGPRFCQKHPDRQLTSSGVNFRLTNVHFDEVYLFFHQWQANIEGGQKDSSFILIAILPPDLDLVNPRPKLLLDYGNSIGPYLLG
jgi:hypothetical protein